ncbi:tetratricopeptide repeat protein [Marinicella sp. W31]|uniref:tetratricopeptide repeat protein n=1 Tax=Marinicella sp. W31 TaxID=3023713 RepID=UPI003757B219
MKIQLQFLVLSVLLTCTAHAQTDDCLSTFKSGDYDRALQVCNAAIDDGQKSGNSETVLSLYLIVADVHKHLNDIEAFERYLDMAQEHPHFKEASDVQYKWHRLKAIRAHHLKRFDVSQAHFNDALELAIEAKDIDRISLSNSDMGVSESAQGRYKSALNYHKKNFDLLKQTEDAHRIGFALRQIGETHMKMEEFQLAAQYFEDAITTFTELSEQPDADHRIFGDIRDVLQRALDAYVLMENEEKVAYYRNLLEQPAKTQETDHQKATRLINLAKNYIHNGAYEQAERALQESLGLYAVEGLYNPQHIDYLLALVYSKTGDREAALRYANSSLEKAQQENNSQAVAETRLLLSDLFQNVDATLALSHYKDFHQQREVFLKQKYDGDLKTVQHQIELEKNERQLMAVELDNVQQKMQIQRLTNRYLLTVIPLLLFLILMLYLYHRRKREKAQLLESIDYHKNQLALMSLDQSQEKEVSVSSEHPEDSETILQQRLVNAMIDATTVWTRHTNNNLVELADRSGIWTITNDNGSLRVRSLEKYLSVQKMPKNPRWRNVIKTCHFVLSEPDLPLADRASLSSQLDELLGVIKTHYGAVT